MNREKLLENIRRIISNKKFTFSKAYIKQCKGTPTIGDDERKCYALMKKYLFIECFRIRQNYENYERVQKAFKEFIHALVWESIDIDAGVHADEVNEQIDKYCRANGNQMITLANNSVTKFIKPLVSRYKVHLYEVDENGNVIEETAKHLSTNNGVIAFKKAAEFYRNAKCPKVKIFDNELDKYVAEWN